MVVLGIDGTTKFLKRILGKKRCRYDGVTNEDNVLKEKNDFYMRK